MAATFRPRRVLVISNETVEADILHDTLVAHADATEVVVVAPALNTRLRHWLSDEDPARLARLRRCPGRDCGWLFLDTSGRRRWCSMGACGSREKMRRMYARRRSGTSQEP